MDLAGGCEAVFETLSSLGKNLRDGLPEILGCLRPD